MVVFLPRGSKWTWGWSENHNWLWLAIVWTASLKWFFLWTWIAIVPWTNKSKKMMGLVEPHRLLTWVWSTPKQAIPLILTFTFTFYILNSLSCTQHVPFSLTQRDRSEKKSPPNQHPDHTHNTHCNWTRNQLRVATNMIRYTNSRRLTNAVVTRWFLVGFTFFVITVQCG